MIVTALESMEFSTGYRVLSAIPSSIMRIRSEMVRSESRCAAESVVMMAWVISLLRP